MQPYREGHTYEEATVLLPRAGLVSNYSSSARPGRGCLSVLSPTRPLVSLTCCTLGMWAQWPEQKYVCVCREVGVACLGPVRGLNLKNCYASLVTSISQWGSIHVHTAGLQARAGHGHGALSTLAKKGMEVAGWGCGM